VIVYIWGNKTPDNFTPRPHKDTIGRPGQYPGLSATTTIPPGRKAQGIDVDKLMPPLRAWTDDPEQGGTAGHYSIAPADDRGEVNIEMLTEWAMTRNTGQIHVLTQMLLDAVVEHNVKGGVP
jgi:hypothetical protein